MIELVFQRNRTVNLSFYFFLKLKHGVTLAEEAEISIHLSTSRTYREQTQAQTLDPTFLSRSSVISKGGAWQNSLRRGTMEVACSTTTLFLLALHCLWTNFLPIIEWVPFYRCTVHSGIHTVHSPTDAHLLKLWLKFTLKSGGSYMFRSTTIIRELATEPG